MRRPTIVCLCGSTRYMDAFAEWNERLTLEGKIVLSVGANAKAPRETPITAEQKARLDQLHLHKIALADEVLVLNVDGYVGQSTKREIAFAILRGKPIEWLNPGPGQSRLQDQAHEFGQLIAALAVDPSVPS